MNKGGKVNDFVEMYLIMEESMKIAHGLNIPSFCSMLLSVLLLGVSIEGYTQDTGVQAPLRFGVFPYKAPSVLVETYGPIAVQLEKKLGRKIVLRSAPDPKTFFAKAKAGEYDLMLATPTLMYKLRPSSYTVIARGEPTFFGGVIVRRDSGINLVDDLKGKKIAAVGEHSYAGYLFLLPLLKEKGIDPEKDVNIQFLSAVDSIVYGVMNKKYDAGVFRIDSLQDSTFDAIRDEFAVIVRSPEIPQFPFMVKKDLDPAVAAAITDVLIRMNSENTADHAVLASMQVRKIIPATDADYDAFYEQVKNSDYLKQP